VSGEGDVPDALAAVLVIAAGYLLGSVPTAYLAGRRRGLDVRTVDTGIAGASNVFRHVSRRAGVVVGALDIAKGAAAVVLARALDPGPWLVFGAGAAAIVGHWWPVFGGFHGGIGAAAGVGTVAAVLPLPLLLAVPFGVVALLWARKPTPAVSTLLAVAVLAAVLLDTPPWRVTVAAGLSLMVLVRALTWRNPRRSESDPERTR
jgi:glycerol-3-phosphate acyltransferase PlsY